MKKFIYFFLFFLVSLAANSQTQRPAGSPSPNSPSGYSLYGYSRADSGFIWGKRDTFPAKFPTIIWHTNGNFYKSNGNGGAWSLFASSTAGTVSSVSGNAPISVANGTTTPVISADTSYDGLATKKWLYKTVDSLGFIKLNISDTAAMLLTRLKVSDTAYMLSGYLRKGDTSAMLSNYVPTFRTINTNAPLFGGGNLSANRTFGIDTGRAVAQVVTGGSLTAVKDSLLSVIASSGGGTVLSVSTTNGFGINSSVATATSTPDITIAVDTFAVSTRAWRNKGVDSAISVIPLRITDSLANVNRIKAGGSGGVIFQTNSGNTSFSYGAGGSQEVTFNGFAGYNANRSSTYTVRSFTDKNYVDSSLALRLLVGDTSAMLSNYRRKTTLIENSDLRNSTISGISLGSNLATLTFGQYLQVGASSYNGSAATTITTNATSTNAGSTLVARDINGDFSARNISATLLGNASSASTIAIANDVTTNATYYPVFSTVTTGATTPTVSSTKLTYNPSSGNLSSTTFTGNLVGNASTATVLQTARTINGVAFDGSANITISAAVGNSLTAGYGITGSPFDGSLARTWVIDTSNISTRAYVTGQLVGYATTGNLALKLNISDTATMLSNYRRKTTLIENSDLRNSAITINGSSTSLGGSISVGTVTSVAASAGTGISVSGSPITSSGTITITNTAPDQTVTLTAGSGISVTGTYPNFTVANTSPSSGGTVTSVSAGTGMSFTTITSSGAVNADTTVLATRAYAAGLDVAKANTSLNNVNGVLSSTYGGAGSVSGILKANGSGVVSAAVNNTDYTLLNGTGFVRMSGTTPSYITGTSSQFVKADGSLDGTSYATAASLSGYVDLTTNQTVAGIKTFSSRIISTGGSLRAYTNGSNTQGAGANLMLSNAAETNFWFQQLNASNNIDWWYFNGSGYVNPMYLTTGGNLGLTGSLSGTSLSMSGNNILGSGTASGSYRLTLNGDASSVASGIIFRAAGTDVLYFGNISAANTTDWEMWNPRNGYLRFGTNNTERGRISSAGNWLIKTTTESPNNEALQVAGSGLFSNGTVTVDASAGNYPRYISTVGAKSWEIGYRSGTTNYEIREDGTTRLAIANGGAATFSSSVTAGGNGTFGSGVGGSVITDFTVNGGSSAYPNIRLTTGGSLQSQIQSFGGAMYLQTNGSTTALTLASNQAATFSSSVTASSFFESSDKRKKDIFNVTKQSDGIDFIGFKWKKELNLDNRKHLGVIAQQVEQVIPDAVTTDEKGFKSVNYTEVLIYKLENLTKKVEELELKLEKLERKTKKTKN